MLVNNRLLIGLGFTPKYHSKTSLAFLCVKTRQGWSTGQARNVFNPKPIYQLIMIIFAQQNFSTGCVTEWLTNQPTDWLTDWLTEWLTNAFRQAPLNSGHSAGLISSPLNITLSWDMPFHQPQHLQCLHPACGLSKSYFVFFCAPLFSLL